MFWSYSTLLETLTHQSITKLWYIVLLLLPGNHISGFGWPRCLLKIMYLQYGEGSICSCKIGLSGFKHVVCKSLSAQHFHSLKLCGYQQVFVVWFDSNEVLVRATNRYKWIYIEYHMCYTNREITLHYKQDICSQFY